MVGRRPAVWGIALSAAVVLAYLLVWLGVNSIQIGRSDFTNTYVGATLFREGQGPVMYNQPLQAALHARLIAPDREGNLPFDAAPLAAVVAAPITLLPLHVAYRIWSLLQLLLIAAATAVAVAAAPCEVPLDRGRRVAIGLIALACLGTGSTLLLGQWDGVSALGLALTYACLRRRRMATAGAVLAVTSLLAKPHLALGLAAFALGWRDRRLILGMLGGGAATLAASLLAVGPHGLAGFVGSLGSQVDAWPLHLMVSLVGISGSLLGQTLMAHVVAAAGSVAAVIVAGALGWMVKRRTHRLEAALAGAAVLSLLAAPHAYWDDLAMLAPVAAWSLTTLVARRTRRRDLEITVAAIWAAISLAGVVDIADSGAPPLGNLTPWTLVAAAGLAIVVCLRPGEPAPPEAAAPSATEQSAGSDVVVRPLSALPG